MRSRPNIDLGLKYRLVQRVAASLQRTPDRLDGELPGRRKIAVPFAQLAGEPDLQLLRPPPPPPPTTAAPAASAASGDADVPGRIGDPGDGHLSGAAAAAAAAASGARARTLSGCKAKKSRPGRLARAGFLLFSGAGRRPMRLCRDQRAVDITEPHSSSYLTATCWRLYPSRKRPPGRSASRLSAAL